MSDADAAELDEAAKALFIPDATNGSPGLWLGIWDPEKGYTLTSYGEAEIGTTPAAPDQTLRIGSVSKTFTAVATLLMVDDGKLALTDTVADVLPDLAAQFPEYGPITVEQLLRMQSGVEDYLNRPDGAIEEIVADPSKVWTTEELVASALTAPVKPAGTFGYSTTNYIVLEEIVAKVAGMPLRDVIAERITGPLGMTRTALPVLDDASLPDPYAHGYATAPCAAEFAETGADLPVGTDTTDWNQSATRGGGGMYSTLEDLGKWALSNSGNSLLSPELQTERLEMEATEEGFSYGMGILQLGPWIGHEGDAFGYQAWSLFDPATGRAAVTLSNTCGSSEAMLAVILGLNPDAGS